MKKSLITVLSLGMLVGSLFVDSKATANSDRVRYQPIENCSSGAITFFETIVNGTELSPRQGIMTVADPAQSEVKLSLVPIQLIRGNFRIGYKLTVPGYEPITIDASGATSLTHQVCTQDSNGVTCAVRTDQIKCKALPPIPTGISVGN